MQGDRRSIFKIGIYRALSFLLNKREELDCEIFTASTLSTEHNPQETQMSRAVDQRREIMQLWGQILISSLLCKKKIDHLLCY